MTSVSDSCLFWLLVNLNTKDTLHFAFILKFDMNSNPATCLICLKNNYDEKSLVLIDVFTQEWNNVTYLNKLQNLLSAEIVSELNS